MEIVMWADLQCPFCYVGEANLMAALKELGIENEVALDIKSREIHRDEDGNGEKEMLQIFQDKEGFTEEGAKERIAAINTMAKEEAGYAIDFGKCRESNDFDAHRLYKYALDHGKGERVRDALHKAYFEERLILNNRETLLEIARACDLDTEDVIEMLAGNAYSREVRNDEMEFRALGLESVPYFIIDTEVVPEHLTKEKMKDVLRRHMKTA